MPTRLPKRTPGRPKSGERTDATRDTVLLAAARLFLQGGYEPVSVQQIAEQAGVTKASVYYYFNSKPVLFTAAVVATMKRISAATAAILAEPTPLRTRLEKLAAARMMHSHMEIEALLQEASTALAEEQQDEIRHAERMIHAVLADGFRRCQADGQIAGGAHPDLLAYAFSSLLLTGNREEQLQDALQGGPALAEQVVALFWSGISPGSAST